jgi:hypothetical protein
MGTDAEYISPDGLLRFIIERGDDDVSLGFAGSEWHTHADLLAESLGVSEQEAVARFVEDLLKDRAIIAVSRVGGVIREVSVTDDPASELRYKPEEEDIEFRYWSGHAWQAS